MKRRSASLFAVLAVFACCARAETLTTGDVLAMEMRLAELGYFHADADGEFDQLTASALQSFQTANGLTADGEPDEATLQALYAADAVSREDYLVRYARSSIQRQPIQRGDIGANVQAMQKRLRDLGFFSGECDGVFGDATQMAVESFQMANGLKANGVADGATLTRLEAENPITWPGFLSEMSAAAGDTGLNV